LVGKDGGHREITLGDVSDVLREGLEGKGYTLRALGRVYALEVEGDEAVREVLSAALEARARVESVVAKRETLEDIFVRRAL
jgi:hypothetical protein